MASSNTAWGIELGSGAIKAIKLAASDGGVEILEYAHVPHSKVLSTPDLDPDDAMRVALGQFAATRDLSKASVGVGIPGNQSFARFAKLPPVEPKKVPEIVKFEAIQQIPFGLEEVEWDYQTFASDDSPEIEVGIFAVTRERVNRQLSMLRDVGILPDAVMVNPVAVFNALSYDLAFTEKTPGTVILDVGTNATDLIVADQGRVWVRTFPLGGHHFTEALVNAFKLSYPKADRLKREAEKSKHARHVFQAMKGVFGDLAQETQRSMGYYQSLHPEAELTRVIGIGSTFQLPGLRRFLKQQLQVEVYRVEQFKRVKGDGGELPEEVDALSLEMMPAYGLALQGLGLNTIGANLMPVSELRRTVWRKKVVPMGIAAGLAVASGAGMFAGYVLDQAALPTEPPVISRVRSTLNTLKREAEEAGVTQSGADVSLGEQLLSLGNVRQPHGRLVADVSELLAFADGQVRSWQTDRGDGPAQGFRFGELSTTYRAGAGGGAMPGAGVSAGGVPSVPAAVGRGGGGGSRGRGGRGFRGAPTPPAGLGQAGGGGLLSPAGDLNAAYDRFEIELTVYTAQPDARDFVLETVRPWLVQNAVRDGVEYTLVGMERELDFVDLGTDRGAGGLSQRRGGGGLSGGRVADSRGYDGRESEGGGGRRVTPRGVPGESRRGGGGRDSGSGVAVSAGGASERMGELSLSEMAPLPEDVVARPENEAKFLIRWTAAYLPPDPGLDGASDGMGEGGAGSDAGLGAEGGGGR
ncbi:MAG: pilus assembly protein PilM [Planctomycetota bacterium]